jgi:hypothetical protein
MNNHWLITRSTEFVEPVEQHGTQEVVITLPHMMARLVLTKSTGDCTHDFAIAAGETIE